MLTPVANHVFDRVGAQETQIQCRRNFQPMKTQDLVTPITQRQRRRRIALRQKLPQIFEGLFPGFPAFGLTQTFEEPL